MTSITRPPIHGIPTVAVLLMTLVLAGCGGLPRSERPAQVEDRGVVPPPSSTARTPQIAAYTPPAQPRIARPEPNRAVAVLMRRADDQRNGGDLDGAAASLERALRIAPEDAVLWHRLAELRMGQGNYASANQLAAKSNALASPADQALRSANWTLIARARRAMGDVDGARTAERRAGELR
jgi:cytochrome c-type biogenesis protein CcmH/NrfG